MKDSEMKNRRNIEEQFFKATISSIDHLDKLQAKELMEKKPFVKIPWYDCLINYVPELIKKYLGVLKTKL